MPSFGRSEKMAKKIVKPPTKKFVLECKKCDCVFTYDFYDILSTVTYVISCPGCQETLRHWDRKKDDEAKAILRELEGKNDG